jgi:hypothetical protein
MEGVKEVTKKNELSEFIGQATAQQIKDWKAKHKRVFSYVVDGKICYLRQPDRLVHAAALKANDPFKGNDIYLSNMWLGGCEDIKTVDKLYLGLCKKISQLIEIMDGELGEL